MTPMPGNIGFYYFSTHCSITMKNASNTKPLIVLGITGSIAAVRAFDLCRELRRRGFEVQVVMSEAAEGIITEAAMEFASGRKVISKISGRVEHVKYFGTGKGGKGNGGGRKGRSGNGGEKGRAGLLLIAPATANTISKIAMGIDDTPVTTFATIAIGSGKPVLLAPAMHEPMYEHPIVRENLAKLAGRGVRVIEPLMAEGKAKLADIEGIVFEVQRALWGALAEGGGKGIKNGPALAGKKVLVASGAFYEKIDEVRVITNLSSGKMGLALAKACALEGAEVKMVGNGAHKPFIDFEGAETAGELEEKILRALRNKSYDCFFCPAAIPDFTTSPKKGKMDSGMKAVMELKPREKLLPRIAEKFPGLKIIAFKALWGKSRNGVERAAVAFRRGNGFFAVVATDLKKTPPGADRGEFFFCGQGKKWLKGAKAEIAGKIVRMLRDRLTGKRSLMGFAGILSDKSADRILRNIAESRKMSLEREKRIEQAFQ